MHIVQKGKRNPPIHTPSGETIVEIVGRASKNAPSEIHSVAHVTIPPGKNVDPHHHKVSEEAYVFLKGKGRMHIDNEEQNVSAGDTCLVKANQVHHLYNNGSEDLEFLAICIPAWYPEDTYPNKK